MTAAAKTILESLRRQLSAKAQSQYGYVLRLLSAHGESAPGWFMVGLR